jgi:hypothetical protein
MAYGQKKRKNDYILLHDSLHVEGKIAQLPMGEFSGISFKSIHESDFKIYSASEVTEFGFKGREFVSRTIPSDIEAVFLEKLETSNKEINLLRVNGDHEVYFVEQVQDGQIFELGESFQETLRQVNTNPLVEPLIPLTKLTESSLVYLLNSGPTVSKKRTLSKNLYPTIYIGLGSSEIQYLLPNIETAVSQPAFSFSGGIGAEAFINFRRTISVNFMPQLMGFNTSSFHVVSPGPSQKYETDISLTWLGVQLPVSGKFYLDLKPQKLRAYVEAGYSFAITLFQNSSQFGALVSDETVVINREKIILPDHYDGALFGIGADVLLSNQQIVNVGARLIPQTARNQSYTIDSIVFSVGYKF